MMKNVFLLTFGIGLILASPLLNAGNTTIVSSSAHPVSPEQEAGYCIESWSTTETHTSRGQWYGPTLVTWLASRTITTLEPVVTAYPATVTDTLISTVTYEYHMTYSDHHTEESYSCAVYTIPFNTRVVDVAPATTQRCLTSPSPANSGPVLASTTRSLACVQMYP